jgi:phage terminase large subunit-like protein
MLEAEIRALNGAIDDERYAWICDRGDCDGRPHAGFLHEHARAKQRPPAGRWLIWDLMAGRGFGKTRTGAETVRSWGEEAPMQIAVIGKKETNCRDLCFEGRSGLLRVIPPQLVRNYNRAAGNLSLTLINGTVFRGLSSQVPDIIRGYAFDAAWVDEWASYGIRVAQEVINQLLYAMRESAEPHIVVTSTPQRVAHQVRMVERALKTPNGLVRLTRGHTEENRANLSDVALELIYAENEGTRMGRQELGGELLDDVEGALWEKAWIDEHLVDFDELPHLRKIVVAIDPAVTVTEESDETGIIAAGRGDDGDDYVLADVSGKVVGHEAAKRAWLLWQKLQADEMVYEANQGGLWVETVLRDAWKELQADPEREWPAGDAPIKSVIASRGKKTRAEPIAARYETGHVHHIRRVTELGTIVNPLSQLEDQQTTWVPGEADSPDRVDAAVWALQRLRDTEGLGSTIQSPAQVSRLELSIQAAARRLAQQQSPAGAVQPALDGNRGEPAAPAQAGPAVPRIQRRR